MIRERAQPFIDVLRVSFISLIPYYIFHSMLILLLAILKYYSIKQTDISELAVYLDGIFPILINLSISYHIAIIYQIHINKVVFIILSLLIFLSVELLHNSNFVFEQESLKYTPLAILIPFILHYFLERYFLFTKKYCKFMNINLSRTVADSFSSIVPFFLFFSLVTSFLYYLITVSSFDMSFKNIDHIYSEVLLFIRLISSNLLWFIGIHGGNFFDSFLNFNILDNDFLLNLKMKEFYDLFLVIGGSGCGLSLLIAILLKSKDKHISSIGKLSLPFVLFNIDEILIFGIPVVLNFSLLIPFFIVPIINFVLSFIVIIYLEVFSFNDLSLAWTTPALINIYLKTDGNIFALLFQLFLIALGTLIYIPFLKKYSNIQSSTHALRRISEKLDVSLGIESKADIKFNEAQAVLVNSHHKIYHLIKMIY